MTANRHDGDTWDLASSVGATATMVAVARARATRADHGLVNDPFAEPLVRAVGVDLLTRLATGELNPDDLTDAPDGPTASTESAGLAHNIDQVLIDAATVRTKFYDEFFLDATNAGVGQVVILAAGLDSRAYRLAWPTGTAVYEVDQPRVIEFKTRTLAELGATPTAERRAVAVDLRDDWPTALRTAGFDPARPTAWSAEGLLGYLPPEAQDRLLDTVTELSAPGSRLATESTPNPQPGDADKMEDKMKEHMRRISERWGAHSFDPDMAALVYFGERNEAAPYLSERGWALNGASIRELFAANGLAPIADDDIGLGDTLFVSGTLERATT
ncbi:SAM-dependent methyltransferase [Mycobacterium helveticum]|uniref:S-adenosyl-L-methionine-dependent methyltransferase n=1 Tax=Mycobacterium helveticum TaxID=2592811 RepID=A0A557XKF7_9MYCO|nr:class I SAM-dependent methyltransferase [Mycobacterium helveticum]TVS83592.1 class I SAM-dependent methyltransferase [Mycobacterium helveticum]TVS86263.1 class I SAM-dependent methyltransferase [Mycobacterium helveticum]